MIEKAVIYDITQVLRYFNMLKNCVVYFYKKKSGLIIIVVEFSDGACLCDT